MKLKRILHFIIDLCCFLKFNYSDVVSSFYFILGFTLGVQQVQPSNEGEYTCRAQNGAGRQEASANLYVRDTVKNKKFLHSATKHFFHSL